jgi:adenylate cyclase
MEKKQGDTSKKGKQTLARDIAIPLAVFIVVAGLTFTPFFQLLESKIFDLFLNLKPAVTEDKSLLLIDVDDMSISKVGIWPWSRDIMADGLILMKEFGARYAIFDIEYTDKSPLGVNQTIMNKEIPGEFTKQFTDIQAYTSDFLKALQTGRSPLSVIGQRSKELSGLIQAAQDTLFKKVKDISRNNDDYLGSAARIFGKAVFTVNMLDEPDPAGSEDLKARVLSDYSLKNVQANSTRYPSVTDIRPAIAPILGGTKLAGFPNVIIDADGTRRRINLITEYGGKYYAQLAFSTLLDMWGNPKITLDDSSITLKGALMSGGKTADVSIPLAEDMGFLINWPPKSFEKSFRHISYWELVHTRRLEENLVDNLTAMNDKDANLLQFFPSAGDMMDAYTYSKSLLADMMAGGDTGKFAEYIQVRQYFYEQVKALCEGDADAKLIAAINKRLAAPDLPGELRTAYTAVVGDTQKFFGATREIYGYLSESRRTLEVSLKDAICIIGNTGTSTTDIGVNPFERRYMNVGTHAAVLNTIMSGKFLDMTPWWIGIGAGLALALLVVIIIRRLKPLHAMIAGTGYLVLVMAAGVGFFLLSNIYPNMGATVLIVFFSFIVLTFAKFLQTEKEKSFIRNAFGHYLSGDVINQLILNPDKLELGGDKKYMTALFTDIKGFSTVSEQLDPTDLVKLLNQYLTEMSNIILSLKGTIDKYEGDAIISFFGAPIPFDDHARRTCLAAVRMKRMERILNEHFLREKLSPTPLYTRFGINTGDMVVGNMGTEQKMDYTMMGNAVNLAARLEGVNKMYGTWILASEFTYAECGDAFLARQLDRLRVVGIYTPVRVYELIEEKASATPQMTEAVGIFHEALALYEKKEWPKAIALFENVCKIIPEDGPSLFYIKRCREYMIKPPADNWDGVYNLTVK